MILMSLSIIYPFWKMLVESFSTPAAAIKMGFKLYPEEVTIQAYRDKPADDNGQRKQHQ